MSLQHGLGKSTKMADSSQHRGHHVPATMLAALLIRADLATRFYYVQKVMEQCGCQETSIDRIHLAVRGAGSAQLGARVIAEGRKNARAPIMSRGKDQHVSIDARKGISVLDVLRIYDVARAAGCERIHYIGTYE